MSLLQQRAESRAACPPQPSGPEGGYDTRAHMYSCTCTCKFAWKCTCTCTRSAKRAARACAPWSPDARKHHAASVRRSHSDWSDKMLRLLHALGKGWTWQTMRDGKTKTNSLSLEHVAPCTMSKTSLPAPASRSRYLRRRTGSSAQDQRPITQNPSRNTSGTPPSPRGTSNVAQQGGAGRAQQFPGVGSHVRGYSDMRPRSLVWAGGQCPPLWLPGSVTSAAPKMPMAAEKTTLPKGCLATRRGGRPGRTSRDLQALPSCARVAAGSEFRALRGNGRPTSGKSGWKLPKPPPSRRLLAKLV